MIWNRTVQRPLLLALKWDGVLVHVTTGNAAGLRASCGMQEVLSTNVLLRTTMYRWKEHLRRHTEFLGPNLGQVSVYALFTLLQYYAPVLAAHQSVSTFEHCARCLVAAHLCVAPHSPQIFDADGVNLTPKSYLAHRLGMELMNLSQLSSEFGDW